MERRCSSLLLVLLSLLLNKSRGERMTRGTKGNETATKETPISSSATSNSSCIRVRYGRKVVTGLFQSVKPFLHPHYIIHPDIVSLVQINPKTFDPCREVWRVVNRREWCSECCACWCYCSCFRLECTPWAQSCSSFATTSYGCRRWDTR